MKQRFIAGIYGYNITYYQISVNIFYFIRKGLLYHLKQLEEALATRKNDGPYLFGTQFTMADVCWVPILDRMESARWWSEVDQKSFPRGNHFMS